LVAVTVNVYDVPLVKPGTTHDVVVTTQVNEPGFDVTVYEITGSPLSTAASQLTLADESARVAEMLIGALGSVAGVVIPETPPVPLPTTFRPTTEKVYCVPFVRPSTVQVKGLRSKPTVVEHVGPGTKEPTAVAVTKYWSTGSPFGVAAFHETVTCVFPRTVTTPVGARGGPAGITAADGGEAADVVTTLVEVTVNVYDVPFDKPRIVQLVGVASSGVVEQLKPPGEAVAV
jgi:hypothetical protein